MTSFTVHWNIKKDNYENKIASRVCIISPKSVTKSQNLIFITNTPYGYYVNNAYITNPQLNNTDIQICSCENIMIKRNDVAIFKGNLQMN